MFADELKSNASRKRAEANRAKRRQLKQKAQGGGGEVSGMSFSSSLSPAVPTVNAISTIAAPTSTNNTHTHSAVEQAKILRQQRAHQAKILQSAILIQAFYRSYRSNQALRQHFIQTLRARLSDIESLAKILKAKKNISFVPPPATTTTMLQQVLWLAKKHCSGGGNTFIFQSDTLPVVFTLMEGLTTHCIRPSMMNVNNDNANPFCNWVESFEGKLRFQCLLRLMICILLDNRAPPTTATAVATFLGQLVASDTTSPHERNARWTAFVSFAHAQLLQPDDSPVAADAGQNPYHCNNIQATNTPPSLDLIRMVRYYLMFVSGGPNPVPESANIALEKCIPEISRQRGGLLLQLLWATLQSHPSHMARAFGFIWTVPLLSWKLPNEALSLLVEPCATENNSSKATNCNTCPMERMLSAFVNVHNLNSNNKSITKNISLPTSDISLTTCPATGTQCLLANLSQIGRLCRMVNGTSTKDMDFGFASMYYNFLAKLLDAVPLMTFHSRESAVEWISDGKGHHTPVVLSQVVLDQCRAVTVDSFVRRIFKCAIDTEYFRTNAVLLEKTDEDRKLEKDLSEASGASNTALAAKEARTDRNKPFWSSSKWAKRLTKNVTGLFKESAREVESSSLVNSSIVSAQLAKGEIKASDASAEAVAHRRIDFDSTLLFSVCRMYAVILARWGGGGGSDITGNHRDNSALCAVAVTQAEGITMSILNALCFSTPVLRVTWSVIQGDKRIKQSIDKLVYADKGGAPLTSCHCLGPSSDHDALGLLLVCVSCLSHTLIVTDDVEIHGLGKPLPLHQLRRVILLLKNLLHKVCCVDSAKAVPCHVGCAMVNIAARAMSDLYNRSSRRPLCLPKVWLIPDLLEKELRSCKTHEDYVSLLSGPVLRVCPQLVSFKRRLKLFERIVYTSRISIQGENSPNPFHSNPLKPARVAVIHRGRILEDGLATMNNLGSNMRQRISVHYVSETGHKETGIDAGGLFKDFWTDLCAIAFDPNYALFAVTEGAGNCLFPSPLSQSAHGTDHLMLFAFLGRILGKALYEGITVHPLFAHFFLSFMKGRYNYLNMLADLSTIDPDLYKNLIFLKTYEGDAADLCLTFTVTSNEFGGSKEIPLIPKGDKIDVTNANKTRYIELVAKYYVVDRIREQSEAFTRGLWEVISPAWLRLFNEPELQVLISGATGGKLDVEDLKKHTRYVGGYSGLDRTINRFWKVVESLDSAQQAKLLRFVTSCERPPPLGFASLNPPFTIQRVGILRDSEKLPSSSTCFNILKLPTYSSEQVLRKKLLYALESASGFELT